MITLAPERPVDQAIADILAVTVDLPELTGKTKCDNCDHPRKSHSRNGCLHNGQCEYFCTVTYMDLRLDPTAVTSEHSHPPNCQCLWCAPWRDDR